MELTGMTLAPSAEAKATVMVVVVLAFALGGLLLAVGEAWTGRVGPRVWRTFVSQLGVSACMLVPLFLGDVWFRAAILVIAVVASQEMFAALERLEARPFRRTGIAVSLGYCVLAWSGQGDWLGAVVLGVALVLLLVPVLTNRLEFAFQRAAATLLGSLCPGLCLAQALRIPERGNGFGDIMFMYVVIEATNAFAFVAGKYLGRRKLRPLLSPNKTIAGSVGGLCAGIVAGALLSKLEPRLSFYGCVLAAALLAVFAQLADLIASAIKRQANIKDFSALTVQGGALDLYDSFILVAPLWRFMLGHSV